MEKQGEQECKPMVVLVPAPYQGHMAPMLQLGSAFHSRGLSVAVAHTLFNPPNHYGRPDFTFLPLPGNLAQPDTTGGLLPVLAALARTFTAPLREHLLRLMEERSCRLCCVVYDSFMNFPECVASELGIPSIMLRTSSALALLVYNSIPRLHEQGYYPCPASNQMDPAPGLHPLRLKELDFDFKYSEALQIFEILRSSRTSSAIILNTNHYLEHNVLPRLMEHYEVPLFLVGPLFKMVPASPDSLIEVDTNCISWLDKQAPKSVLYVSLGSVATIDEKELVEMAWGLANSNQPFLSVIRPGMVCGSDWIEFLPEGFKETVGERGHIVKWAPQREVLAHEAVGGFWSHCGWNSTLEGICEGVPIICGPSRADQHLNARYLVCVWQTGLDLEVGLGRGEFERAVRTLMQEEVGEKMRQRATELKEKLKICTSEDGSSYQSLNALAQFIQSLNFQK